MIPKILMYSSYKLGLKFAFHERVIYIIALLISINQRHHLIASGPLQHRIKANCKEVRLKLAVTRLLRAGNYFSSSLSVF